MSLFLNNNVGYTIVGNPTIIRGILFNTDIDNYIKTTSQIDFSTEFNLEFYVRFKTPSSSVNGFHTIISTGDLDSPLLAVTTNGGYYYLVGYGEDLYRVQLTYDTYYRVKLVRKNETVWQTSIYNDDGRLLRTSPEKTKSITYTNKNILFGCPYGPANPVIPEIILKDCYIKVNNITWFNGKQTTSTSIQDIKFNNNIGYTTIGTPTISDGIASNFSNGNYIKLQSNIPIITSFEENVRFKITQDCVGKSLLSYSTTYNSNNLEGNINISNNLDSINVSLFIKYDGTYEEYSIQYNFSQHLNKYFTFKVYTDLSNVYLYLYDENNNLVGTNTYTNINLVGIIDNNKILIGNVFDESDYWPSEIDLNNTYIKFNDITWFNGKEQTSIDVNYLVLNGGKAGYTVNGSPTINNGVVSGFNSSDYLKINNFQDSGTSCELNFTFTTPSSASNSCLFYANNFRAFFAYNGTKLNVVFNSGGSQETGYIDYTFNYGTKYTVNILRNGTTAFVKIYKGTTLEKEVEMPNISAFNNGNSTTMLMGYESAIFAAPFAGSIDLNETYIKVNNEFWFNGGSKLVWANPNIYLQGDGNSCILTDYAPSYKTTVDIKVGDVDNWIIGARQTSGTIDFGIAYYLATFGKNILQFTNISSGTHTFNYGQTLIKDGVTIGTFPDTTSVNTVPFLLFGARTEENTNIALSSGKIYYCKIYDDGVLVNHFIPVPANFVVGDGYKTPSAGMFDIVEQKFYSNLGTGSFTYGKD